MSLGQKRNDACQKACMIEVVVCCCLGLWCVFCCHSCIEKGCFEPQIIVSRINGAYFQGQPVFRAMSNETLTINTDAAQQVQQQMQYAQQQPQYAQQQPQYAQQQPQYAQQPQYQHPQYQEPVMAQAAYAPMSTEPEIYPHSPSVAPQQVAPQQQQQRTMAVVVPLDAKAGSVIRAQVLQ
jgi:hypothetical protein